MESEEWSHVNRDLRHHGFPSVELTDPATAKNISDLVLLSSEMARILRQTLTTLLRDCDRRQELIQELISTNNQLREELSAQTNVSEKYEHRTRDLQNLLDSSMLKIQEMSESTVDMSLPDLDETERLRNTKDAATSRCKHLSRQCTLYQDEVTRLTDKLTHISLQEEKHKKKQNEVLQQLRRKWAKGTSVNDNVLTVVDWYETQVGELKQELELAQSGIPSSSNHMANTTKTSSISRHDGGTGNYKAMIKSYENQLRDAKKKMKTLENETELLKLEMQSRPELKDLRDSQARVKKLERVLKKHGVCPVHNNDKKASMLFSTSVEDIEFLPVAQCRQHLKAVCEGLEVDDVTRAVSKVEELTADSNSLPHLKQFSESVIDTVQSTNHRGSTPHAVWCERTTHSVISTLQDWSLQIHANKELQQSIQRLVSSAYPWRHLDIVSEPSTRHMIRQIDNVLVDCDEDTSHQSGTRGVQDHTSKTTLQEIVSHFQNLFDVPNISGVYVRMNDIYTKLGEVHNVMKTLRDLLGLESDCKLGVIVDAVSRLSNRRDDLTSEHLRRALGTEDLDSVIFKLKEHDDFFPIFHELLEKLLEVLNVSRVDQVLPAIRALKLLAGS